MIGSELGNRAVDPGEPGPPQWRHLFQKAMTEFGNKVKVNALTKN